MNLGKSRVIVVIVSTLATLAVIALLIGNIIIAVKEEQANAIIGLYVSLVIISLFTYGILQISYWRARYSKIIGLVNSINTIDSAQEEIFGVGMLIFDFDQNITYISPWLQKEGFDGLLGKKYTTLDIDINNTNTKIIDRGSHKWEVTVSQKAGVILFKDITSIETLRGMIDSQLKAVASFHTAFSKKVSFNDSVKADATLKINQTIKEWIIKQGGLFNSSLNTEGTISAAFNWRRGEKDVYSEYLLDIVKKVNPKLTKDITISVGVSFGDADYTDLLDASLRSLEISKNRGGDQIVLSDPSGELEYIGLSTQSAVSGTTLDIKRFYSEFMTDLSTAKDIYITSHKMADLDAIGSALGLKKLAEQVNNDVSIVIKEFDATAQKFFDTLPKKVRDSFISDKAAMNSASSRAHYIITDTSNPDSTQAELLLSEAEVPQVTIIDHHILNKGTFEYEESKTLINTSTSSASELVVEMLKISLGADAQAELEEYVSTGLLSGIKLDSKQLSKNVTNATFEAVAWLMNNDANTTETEAFFKPSQDLIKLESEAFANIQRPAKGVIFTHLDETIIVSDEDTSILADKLLSYDGVEATFVLAKTESGRYKMSARSATKINVQDIAESVGGGGHFNVAAASWSATTKYSTIINKINKEISKLK